MKSGKKSKRRGRVEFLGVFHNGKLFRGPAHTLKQANGWLKEIIENRASLALDTQGWYVQRYKP